VEQRSRVRQKGALYLKLSASRDKITMESYQSNSEPRSSAGACFTHHGFFEVSRELNGTDHVLHDMLMLMQFTRMSSPQSIVCIGLHGVRENCAFVLCTKLAYQWQAFMCGLTSDKLCVWRLLKLIPLSHSCGNERNNLFKKCRPHESFGKLPQTRNGCTESE
jgi:hypothetical protein